MYLATRQRYNGCKKMDNGNATTSVFLFIIEPFLCEELDKSGEEDLFFTGNLSILSYICSTLFQII